MLSQHYQPPSPWHPEGDGGVPSPLGLPCHRDVRIPTRAGEGTPVPQGISKAPHIPAPSQLCPVPLLQVCFHSSLTRAGSDCLCAHP